MMRRFFSWLGPFALVTGMVVLPVINLQSANAATYDQGIYSACFYSDGCSNTIVETPKGLEVAINLSDGQVLPADGYTIMVTPLNGQGATFAYVEFYVDNQLLSTFYPDGTGTATWLWNTATQRGTHVKVVVYDTDGQSVIKEFTISIAKPGMQPQSSITKNPTASTSGSSPSILLDQFLAPIENTLRSIPTPVAVTIPYALLFLLLIIIVLLFIQSHREAREARRQRITLQRAKQLAEEKEGFIQLTSHYLRTPLTLIRGGADMLLALQPPINSGLILRLSRTVEAFGSSVEGLLARVTNDARLRNIQAVADVPVARPTWLRPLFWLPLVLIGLLVLFINYLLIRTDKLDLSTVSIATQVAIFMAMAVGLYMVLRWRQIVRRDRVMVGQQEAQQIAIDEARNYLIREATATLTSGLETIKAAEPEIPESKAKQFIHEGYSRISKVLQRFRETATVIPPVTAMPFRSFRFSDMLAQVQSAEKEALQAKHISLAQTTSDAVLFCQQPAWIGQVFRAAVDNAVAFSPSNSQINVGVSVVKDWAHITVQDHGAGIPQNKLAELFQPFSKVESPLRFDHPGLGLSLYLSRLLLASLNGAITITSDPKEGTLVEIAFPMRG